MQGFEVVAHRGATERAPENTMEAFQRAVELGADAIELDVRLTADRVTVVYHYFYLENNTTGRGPIFEVTLEQLRQIKVLDRRDGTAKEGCVPTLAEVLETIGGKIGLEIEMKGPEPEAPHIIGRVLDGYRSLWPRIEVTSYEPALLLAIQEACPGLTVDLLFPRSESWMRLDVVQYVAAHHARLAKARVVHLHPSQLSEGVVEAVCREGIDIHVWDANDEQALRTAAKLGIRRICTDRLTEALAFRDRIAG